MTTITSAHTYYALGLDHSKNNDWLEAIRCYRQVLQLQPDFSVAELALGHAQTQLQAELIYEQRLRQQTQQNKTATTKNIFTPPKPIILPAKHWLSWLGKGLTFIFVVLFMATTIFLMREDVYPSGVIDTVLPSPVPPQLVADQKVLPELTFVISGKQVDRLSYQAKANQPLLIEIKGNAINSEMSCNWHLYSEHPEQFVEYNSHCQLDYELSELLNQQLLTVVVKNHEGIVATKSIIITNIPDTYKFNRPSLAVR
ncbi:tetratricopeptide repeat protein [Anaerolineales bacterium HSG6]|nr:tetratricopeptide repeat protein [Anaerolineales bacterium HSG6]